MSKAAKDNVHIDRYVVSAKILGKEKRQRRKKFKKQEFAIDVILSDESQYTVYRSMKDIVTFHKKLMSRFPVEAGHFSDKERVIPKCPIKKTLFGFRQVFTDDGSFNEALNSYIKKHPALPGKMIKTDVFQQFFTLLPSDMDMPLIEKKSVKAKKSEPVMIDSGCKEISSPIVLKSYITLADFKSSEFSFKKNTVVQVVQKESKGWWLIDIQGMIGWAPASFLVPVDKDDIENEFKENEALISTEKVGARYISTSAYQASRDDELSFVKGAVVRVIKKYTGGWWLVRYNGKEGFAPAVKLTKFDNRQASFYVKGIKRSFSKRRSTRVSPTMKMNWQVDKKTQREEKCKCVAMYQCLSKFIGREDKFEISSLNKGDTVQVLERKHHGWWYVEDQHGCSGWAPATYFQTIYDPSPDHVKGDEIIGSVYFVVHSFLSQREDELTVNEGEKVLVIGVSDDGWWMVRQLDNPLMQGLIPCLCLKKEEETDEPQISGNGICENTTSTQEVSNSAGSDNSLGISRENLVQSKQLEDCYVVASDYSKKEIDEIDVFEGEIACFIDSSQTDIWYVNVNGKEGWIPSDVLRPLSDDKLNEKFDTNSDSLLPHPTVSLPLHPGSEIVPESEVASLPSHPVSEIASSPPHPIMSAPLSYKDSDSPIDFDSHSNHHVLNTKQQTPQSSISSEDKTQNSIIVIVIQSEDESLEELERTAAVAEHLANELLEKANILRKKAEDIRKCNSMNLSS